MRLTALLTLLMAGCSTAPSGAGDAFGVWTAKPIHWKDSFPQTVQAASGDSEPKGSPADLVLAGEPVVRESLKSLIVRFEPHAKGELFTLERIATDGRATTSSTILYLDGQPRDFQDFECSGTQSSRRVDNHTVEILHKCASGEWTRFIRRLSAQPKELILNITGQRADGRRFERRLVLEKQLGGET